MDECTKAIINFSQNPSPFVQYISNSGKGLNELGDYNDCLKDPNSSYFLIKIFSSILPPELSSFVGMCFLKSCAPEQIKSVIPLVASRLNMSVDGMDFSVLKSNGNESEVTIDHSTYIIVVVLCMILALGFIHPILSYLKSSKKKEDSRKIAAKQEVEVEEGTVDATLNATLLPNKQNPRNSRMMEFFKCFAVDLNLKRLFSIREGPLDFFNGVRAMSLLYVILGHDYYLRSAMSQNPLYLLDFIRTPFYLIIGTAFYAVDVFFWLSGFFLAFVLLDPSAKKYLKKPLTYGFAIFNRYCRIIPAYLVAIVIYWKVVVLTGSGPLWPNFVDRTSDCQYMWRNILFIENLFSMWGDMHYCFGWGWYLSNDFQLFIISLILIFAYAQNHLFGKLFLWMTIIGTSIAGVWVIHDNGFLLFPYQISGYSVYGFMNDYYYKPWCRAPPYLYGVFLGMLYKEHKNREKECEADKSLRNNTVFANFKRHMTNNLFIKYSFYVVGFFLVLFFSFFPKQIQDDPNAWSENFIIFWLSFQRLIFVIGLSLIFMNSLIVGKDIIAKILAWKPFGVITNISFCAYLVHYFIIERSFLGSRQTIIYGTESVLYMYFTDIFFTLVLAGVLSVFVEMPFINLEKFIKGDKKKQEIKKEVTITDEKRRKEETVIEDDKKTIIS